MKGNKVETVVQSRKGFMQPARQRDTAEINCVVVNWSESLPPELERFWRTDDGLTAIERAEAYGIDLSLLDENLRLTPGERMRRNDEALALVTALQEAVNRGRS